MRRGVMEAPSRFRSNLTEAMMMFKVDDDADVEQPEPVHPRVQHRNRHLVDWRSISQEEEQAEHQQDHEHPSRE